MASELQRRKTALVFAAMDVDFDGFLDQDDFAALAARWTVNRGLAPGSPEGERLAAIMLGWWEVLLAASDTDRDEKVTLDEVLLVVEQLAADTAPVAATATAMFEAIDANGDGRISAAEYRELIETWTGVSQQTNPTTLLRANALHAERREADRHRTPADTDEIFSLLDLDGDGHISREEFVTLWTEFWAGDNPNAAGTWVFGRFELPLQSV